MVWRFMGDTAMFVSMGFIIIGNGFFKPNISTLLGNIYSTDELKPKKDSAYNIFYMGINIGAFFCNFVAAYLRNYYGWGYAFAAAGVGMTIGLSWFIYGMKHVKSGDVVKPVQKEDMPISKIFGYVFIPAIIVGAIGWNMKSMIGHPLLSSKSNDAFFFACIPIIIFYVGLLLRATKEDKRGLGALLSFFLVSIVFWVIYNQNSTALTIWADSYTHRKMPVVAENIAKPFGMLQTVKSDSVTQPKLNHYFVQQQITADMKVSVDSVFKMDAAGNKVDSIYTVSFTDASNTYLGRGIFHNRNDAMADTKVGASMNVQGLDPYFNNLPLDERPAAGGELKLLSPEIFQSVNPLFIVIFTPLFVALFSFLRMRKKEPSTPTKIGIGMIVAGLSSLLMILAITSKDIYSDKTNMLWLISTYAIFTIGELLISPIGLSMVSKLAPARLTALMMGAWFLVNAMAGKISGMMASYWDVFTDKRQYFLILFVAAMVSAGIIFMMVKWLHAVVREKTGIN